MKVRIVHNGQVHVFEGPQTVIVENNAGSPVSVASDVGVEGTFVISTVNDPDFNDNLRKLGLDITVIVQKSKLVVPSLFR